jgi:hypothetical protein
MDLPADAGALLGELSIHIYQEPLASAWRSRRELPEVLRTVLLILDFDTEVTMNGLGGVLENTLGGYLREIVAAFEAVGATKTADALREIEPQLRAHGISHARLREDFDRLELHAITSFEQTHGEQAASMLDQVIAIVEPRLYAYGNCDEDPLAMLEKYVERHAGELRKLTLEALRPAQ